MAAGAVSSGGPLPRQAEGAPAQLKSMGARACPLTVQMGSCRSRPLSGRAARKLPRNPDVPRLIVKPERQAPPRGGRGDRGGGV